MREGIAYKPKTETIKNAEAILGVLNSSEEPNSLYDIARQLGLGKGRHTSFSRSIKYLLNHNKIIKTGSRRSAKYVPYKRSMAVTSQEVQEIVKEKPQPVCMIELPKATLKVLVKAVMANCSPMDALLQRAVLQCMEKLI